MSVNINSKKPCVVCTKNAGILVCDGCQQSFCGRHVMEHRQNLGVQLDCLMQEHDLLQQQAEHLFTNHPMSEQIDQWELKSISKIQRAAKTARTKLPQILDQIKGEFSTTFDDIRKDLQASHAADDYSEADLMRWTKQLEALKADIHSPDAVEMIEDKNSVIHLIQIENNREEEENSSSDDEDVPEKFARIIGPAEIEDDGCLVQHIGDSSNHAYISGDVNYCGGIHTIRFKIERCRLPYRILFGCTTSTKNFTENIFRSSHLVGWLNMNEVYRHGRLEACYGTPPPCSTKTNDVLQLTLDCDNKRIELYNERLDLRRTLPVDIQKTPLPWLLVVIIFHERDRVRMLPDE